MSAAFPDPLALDAEKRTKEYGLKVARSISSEWFGDGIINDNCAYAARRLWIRENRLYVRGEQDLDAYKKFICRNEGDMELLNLDWRPLNIAEKFCNIVINGINDRYYRLDIRAIDKTSAKLRNTKEAYYKKQMRVKPLLENMANAWGVDLRPKGFIPEDDEEMRLHMEIKERPKIEISEELMIDYVKKSNGYEFIEKQKNIDLVENGLAASRIEIDKTNGVVPHYVDIEYLVHSRVRRNDFKDAFYFGEVVSMTINDLQRDSDFTEKELRKIAKTYASVSNNSQFSPSNFESCAFDEIVNIRVDVLKFCYKTSKSLVYKKSTKKGGRVKYSKKDDSYDPPKRNDYTKQERIFDTWYEGSFVIGSDFIYNYQECENLETDERNSAISPYRVRATKIYKNKLHSFLSNIKGTIDQMQYIHLKMQQLTAELKPDITVINLDALAELGDGEGGSKQKDWKYALSLLNVKGAVFEKTVDMGDIGAQRLEAARTKSMPQGSALTILLQEWAHYYNLLRDITGINPVRDGSQAHNSLVGTNEMALMASNTSTQHIVETAISFNKDVCESISTRLHTIFSHKEGKHLQKIYELAVGKHNLEAVEMLKDRHLHEFGFTVEMNPTADEVKEFKEDLAIAMQEGYIDVEDKQQAQQIFKSNFKLANQYLQYRRRKRKQQLLQERQYEAQLQSQSNEKAAFAAKQAEVQAYAQMTQIDVQKARALTDMEVLKMRAQHELKLEEGEVNFNYDVYKKQMDAIISGNEMQSKRDAEIALNNKRATQQSRMIDQRNKDSEPIDFESLDLNSMFQ